MDLIITTSEHSKKGFVDSVFDKIDEKTKQKDYAPNQDFYITDTPSQPTLRVDFDTDEKFYYNGT